MEYNQLGQSELRVSKISFGCMSLGTDHTLNHKLLRRACDLGINFFDTADLYQHGQNEITVGKAFKGMRNKVIIATKVGNQLRADGSGWDWNPRKEYILKAVDDSIRRLDTDYIDLYQLHGGTIQDPVDETIEAFEQLKRQGKIRYYGISSIRPNVIREYVKKSAITSVMMQYSLADRRPEETCLDLLTGNHVGVLARGTLAKGLLTGKTPDTFLSYTQEEMASAAAAIRRIAGKNRTPEEVAFQFVLRHPAIVTAVAGISSLEQLERNAAAGNAAPLNTEEIETLEKSLAINTYHEHR